MTETNKKPIETMTPPNCPHCGLNDRVIDYWNDREFGEFECLRCGEIW